MTVGAITSVAGARSTEALGGGAVPIQPASQNAARAEEFTQAYAVVSQQHSVAPQQAGAVPTPEPAREISRITTHSPTYGQTLGGRILDRLEAIHRGDRSRNGDAKTSASMPTVKVASLEPGPAAAALRELPTGAEATARPASKEPAQFKDMLEQMQQVYGQVIQVSVVSKTTGNFTSSMNRLMSSS